MMLNVVTARTNSFLRLATIIGKPQWITSGYLHATQTLFSSAARILTISEIHQQLADLIRKDDLIPIPACPKSVSGLKPRTMAESFMEGLIPLQDPEAKTRYHNTLGGLRIGRLLEDLDVLGAACCFRHNLEDFNQKKTAMFMITITAEELEVCARDFDTDACSVKIAGNVSWVGSSSMEVPMNVSLLKDSGQESVIMKATFVFSARDSTDLSAAVVNPLIATNAEEEKLIEMGHARARKRREVSSESYWKSPPNIEDTKLIHSMFMESLDRECLSLTERTLPPNSVWMESTKRTNTYPATADGLQLRENKSSASIFKIRSGYGTVFGGYLMRGAVEMAFTTAAMFSQQPVRVIRVDDLQFRKSVDANTLLSFTAEIAYTEGNVMQVRVQIDVHSLTSKFTSNTVYLTLSCDKDVPRVMPKTYGEYLLYIEGRRRFKEATKHQPQN